MSENRCVICGEIIPEGKQVCVNCDKQADERIKAVSDMATDIMEGVRMSITYAIEIAQTLYSKGYRKMKGE